ncbi:Transcription factor [Komagataella phaffii CBS 7435]|uniref:Transcription factor n=2 Tax=Komagataella phaffii TaxID=460519 RepID=C4R5W4_KOMPG|nr:uncharacterized protein PAS_chr3_1235 [Komagataella phaffii GS115]AOA64259.1 GQ67_04016T0 [Komagataella phaffii]CAH2449235.1 Transcription factor [Komagataella phaffii CBS 7435]AOA68660.1 GQ68_03989T0 [Komagataella phaffii GS115]CAY70950.1 hypothetical protein PAS_chr3_1235 [Komagataella phaffii GS115]CCA39251.1 Transcription factor [Komagataella phaffii CBS 7435]
MIKVKEDPTSVGHGSTDFVKKLYQMLEDESYRDIVRWTDSGDSFVVLSTNEFTKDILPKHFKHSNFASFVRQLNKYDFHKVKLSNEDKQRMQMLENGEIFWEFKHPLFKRNELEALENIKRKGPIQKKPGDDASELAEKVEFLTRKADDLENELGIVNSKYNTIVESVLHMRKLNDGTMKVLDTLVKCLHNAGIKIPPLEIIAPMPGGVLPPSLGPKFHPGQQPHHQMHQPQPQQQQPQPQQQQQQIQQPQQQQQQQHINFASQTFPAQAQHPLKSISSSADSSYSSLPNLRNPEKHPNPSLLNSTANIVKKPSVPHVDASQISAATPLNAPVETNGDTQRGHLERPEGSPFHVLLVEDDNVCIKLCQKFLMKYGCTVQVVTDGLSAVDVVGKVKFDLVLMDIVMPNLDGASATAIIRNFDSQTPIIAMTGNIEDQDLLTYLEHGMTDILAKPFTKDDLYMMLEKHLIKQKMIDPLEATYTNGDDTKVPKDSNAITPDPNLLSEDLVIPPSKRQRI